MMRRLNIPTGKIHQNTAQLIDMKIKVILIFLFSFNAYATLDFQIGTGGLTPHFTSSKKLL